MSRPVRHPSALNPVIVGMRSGSDELPALERALELATQRHTHLVVVHVIPATSGFAIAVPTAAGAVALTGGTVAGIADLAVADGGTGASSASAADWHSPTGAIPSTTTPWASTRWPSSPARSAPSAAGGCRGVARS